MECPQGSERPYPPSEAAVTLSSIHERLVAESLLQWHRSARLAILRFIDSWNQGLRFDHSRSHKRRYRDGIFFQSLETEMHVVLPIEPFRVRSGPLLHCFAGIEKKKVVSDANFLHRRADKIIPHVARSVGFQVLKMRVIDEQHPAPILSVILQYPSQFLQIVPESR